MRLEDRDPSMTEEGAMAIEEIVGPNAAKGRVAVILAAAAFGAALAVAAPVSAQERAPATGGQAPAAAAEVQEPPRADGAQAPPAAGAQPQATAAGARAQATSAPPSSAGTAAAGPTKTETIRGINGEWERYPTRFSGLGSEPVNGPPPPEAVPEPPLKPEYLEKWRAHQAKVKKLSDEGHPPANNYSNCLPDGMPAMMQAMFPMEVLETPGQITVIEEAFNQVRRIYLGEKPLAPEDAEPRFEGHSAGHWEGNTLVVETVGVKDYVRFRDVPHSMDMRIVERIRLVGHEFMRDDVTVTDPQYLTRAWTWTWMYRRWPGYKIQEYVCEDNRYDTAPGQGSQTLRIDD